MPVGNIAANCYFIVNEETKEVVCIDTGDEGDKICELIQKNGWKLSGIFLTHGHVDHIGAVPVIKQWEKEVLVYAGKQEERVLEKPELNLTTMFGRTQTLKADRLLEDGECVQISGISLTCIATPGHTEGSVCYYLKNEKAVFTGDTLFCKSVGRTDFPTGNLKTLEHSIRNKLYMLPDDTIVYPGHDGVTSIRQEKEHNMFVRG